MSLLTRIEEFRHARQMAVTTFGRRAVNDPRLVLDMRRGRQPGPDLVARVEAFITGTPA